MTYQTPQLTLIGSATGLVLGSSLLVRKYRDNIVGAPPVNTSRNTELE